MSENLPSGSRLARLLARTRVPLAQDERAATAIEYALVASGIGAVIAATIWSVGSALKSNFYDAIANMFS